MKRKRIDTDMPLGKLKEVNDFLPTPEELMADEKMVKVTLRLSESSLKFFKQYADKYHTKYQKVIRKLVDTYAVRYAVPRS